MLKILSKHRGIIKFKGPLLLVAQKQRGNKSLSSSSSSSSSLKPSNSEIAKLIVGYIWPNNDENSWKIKSRVIGSLGLLMTAKAATIATPFIFKELIDFLNQQHPSALELSPSAFVAFPTLLVLSYGFARSTSSLAGELQNSVFATVSQTAIQSLSRKAFLHLHSLDLAFHLNRRTGAIAQTIDRGGKSISALLSSVVFRIVPTTVELSLVLGILASQCGPSYAAVSLATLVTYTGYTIAITNWRTSFRREMNKRESEASATLYDSLINYETVAYFGNQIHEANRYDKSLVAYRDAAIKTQSSLGLLNFGQNAIFSAGLTAIMYLATNEVLNGSMSVGDIVLVNGLLFQLSLPLNFVGSVYRETRQALTDMEEVLKLQKIKSSLEDLPNAKPLVIQQQQQQQQLIPAIEFKDVWFAYEDAEPILRGISFTVMPGQTVAVVGTSGSGKSTLLRLLFRFMRPSGGSVNVMGEDVKNYTLQSLRKNIGVVAQDTVLFNDTLKYNIAYGNMEKATPERLNEVVRASQLEEALNRVPQGWDALVGERGLKLSGGEKQRVSIARCMLKDAPILICDEPTSSLDSKTGAEIMKSLKGVAKHRIGSIIIAHRLGDIRDSDKIVVLDKGRVVESGHHEELLQLGGVYSKLWSEQHKNTEHKNTEKKTHV